MDSSGIQLLVRMDATWSEGQRLRVINASPGVGHVIDLAGAAVCATVRTLGRPWPRRRLVQMRPHRDAVAYVLSMLLVLLESPLLLAFVTGAAIARVVRAFAAMGRHRAPGVTSGAAARSR